MASKNSASGGSKHHMAFHLHAVILHLFSLLIFFLLLLVASAELFSTLSEFEQFCKATLFSLQSVIKTLRWVR